MKLTRLPIDAAIPHLQSGDIAFYRVTRKFGWSWFLEKAISWWQNSPYIHVGLILIKEDGPWVIDMSAFSGGREIPLAGDLEDYEVDIYRANQETSTRIMFKEIMVLQETHRFNVERIFERARKLIQKPYSWRSNLRIMFERWMRYDRLTNEAARVRDVNCAILVGAAYSETGFDLCPRVSPRFVTPDRLARSAMIDYLCTIDRVK